MENLTGSNTPVLEVRYEFQQSEVVFIPSLDEKYPYGLLYKFETFLQDTFSVTYVIPRIAQSPQIMYNQDGSRVIDNYLCKYSSVLYLYM